jgi:ribosomal-protein-alanine N-acetyltransferase
MADPDYSLWRLYPMRIADLDQVLVIEEYSFPTPWQRRMYEQDLSTNQYSRFFVIKHIETGEVAAYIGSWFIIDEAHIGTIATKREMRGMRFAEQLIAYSALQASNEGMTYIILEVRTGNQAAIRLYERLGFERVGLRRKYYTDTGEDAYLMVCRELDNLAERLRIDEGVPPIEE